MHCQQLPTRHCTISKLGRRLIFGPTLEALTRSQFHRISRKKLSLCIRLCELGKRAARSGVRTATWKVWILNICHLFSDITHGLNICAQWPCKREAMWSRVLDKNDKGPYETTTLHMTMQLVEDTTCLDNLAGLLVDSCSDAWWACRDTSWQFSRKLLWRVMLVTEINEKYVFLAWGSSCGPQSFVRAWVTLPCVSEMARGQCTTVTDVEIQISCYIFIHYQMIYQSLPL